MSKSSFLVSGAGVIARSPMFLVAMVLCTAVGLSACGKKGTELGGGSSEVTGSAGPAGAKGENKSLVKYDAPVATLALAENPNGYVMSSSYNLPSSPVPLVRLLAQQSGCFRVVDRSSGLRGTIQEQQLKESGVLRKQGNTVDKGKGYEAQYTLIPNLTFSEQDAGRSLGGVLAHIPIVRDLGAVIGIVEQIKLKEAQVALLLTDNETTEQVAAATGSARTTDLGLGGLAFGGMGGVGGVGWSNTNEGKVIAAAFLDAHNKLVVQARELMAKDLPPPVATKKTSSKGL